MDYVSVKFKREKNIGAVTFIPGDVVTLPRGLADSMSDFLDIMGPAEASSSMTLVPRSLVSRDWILSGATAGQNSGWIPYIPGMRLAYALDSGTTPTSFSVDISADGSTSLGQAFTGTWASSTSYEISPPIWLQNQAARYIRFNVLSGGPLSVRINA